MLKFNIAAIKEGQSFLDLEAKPNDIGLEEQKEFNKTIHISHHIHKVGNEVFIKANLQTTLDLRCDVCLDSFLLEVNDHVDVILTSDPDLAEQEEDDVYLVQDVTTEVDITESIQQAMLLDIPFRKKCSPTCKGLCSSCGANLNNGLCSCENDIRDSRWDALKGIKFD